MTITFHLHKANAYVYITKLYFSSISDVGSEPKEEARPHTLPQADDNANTDGEIEDLLEGTSCTKDTQQRTEDKDAEAVFLKSLKADLEANIAKKRWVIALSSKKLKPFLAKHDKQENCIEITVPKVNQEIRNQSIIEF